MIEDFKIAAQAAAMLTGAECKVEVGILYAERFHCQAVQVPS